MVNKAQFVRAMVLVTPFFSLVCADSGGLALLVRLHALLLLPTSRSMQDVHAAVKFGPEGDANLWREGNSTLKTDSSVLIAGSLSVSGNITVGRTSLDLLATVTQQSKLISQQALVIKRASSHCNISCSCSQR